MAQPEFALYVRSVEGHAVPRYGSTGLIGAERIPVTAQTKRDGECPVKWNDRIVPISKANHSRFRREFDAHIRNKELEEVSVKDWRAQCELDAELEAEASKVVAPETTNTDDESGKDDAK